MARVSLRRARRGDAERVAEIWRLGWRDGHLGSGVARVLMHEAERLVAADGHRAAWLAVVPANARARAFYEKAGWRDEGPFDYMADTERGPVSVRCHRYVKSLLPPARRA